MKTIVRKKDSLKKYFNKKRYISCSKEITKNKIKKKKSFSNGVAFTDDVHQTRTFLKHSTLSNVILVKNQNQFTEEGKAGKSSKPTLHFYTY